MKGETVPLYEYVNDDMGEEICMPPMPHYFVEFTDYEEVEELQLAIRSCLVNTPALQDTVLAKLHKALLSITPGIVMEQEAPDEV